LSPKHPGLVLGAGLALSVLAALAPAGLSRPSVPPWSWGAWALAFAGGAAAFRLGGSTLAQLVRGARALRVPPRLVDVLEAALSRLAAMIDQARAMLRAEAVERARLARGADLP